MVLQVASRAQFSQQSGGVLVLVTLCCFVILGILGFAIDIPRGQVEINEFQNALDAAALAGVRQLDGTSVGVARAREVAQAVLAKNSVSGKSLDPDNIELQFGFYGASEQGEGVFEALTEGVFVRGLPAEAQMNALRVAGAGDTPTTFSRLFGVKKFDNIRSATAVRNQETWACVNLPLALPACEFLKSLNPNDPLRAQEQINSSAQCQREIYITGQASWWEERFNIYERVGQGIWRYQWAVALPQAEFDGENEICGVKGVGRSTNCLAEPVQGVFALAQSALGQLDSEEARQLADYAALSPKLLLEYMQKAYEKGFDSDGRCPAGAMPVELWSRLHVVEDGLDTANGVYLDPHISSGLSKLLYRMIMNEENPTLKEAFGDPKKGTAKPNFPYLRTDQQKTTNITWPNFEHQMLFGNNEINHYTIPTCHYKAEDPDSGEVLEIPVNDLKHGRALKVIVPLVAPEDPDLSYCDPQAQFLQTDFSNVPIYSAAGAAPVVVGFAEVNLFDFNIQALEEENLTPPDHNPLGISVSEAN